MNLSDYTTRINKIKLYKKDSAFITDTEALLIDATKFLTQVKAQVRALETAISDGYGYLEEVIDEFTDQTHAASNTQTTASINDGFVFQTKNGMLSYKDKCLYGARIRDPVLTNLKNKPAGGDAVHIKELNIKSNKIRQVSDLHTMQPALAYFAGDKKYPEGIYTCIDRDVFVRIPFPQVIDSQKEQNKYKTVRCKYKTKRACDEQKNKMASYHSSSLRSCNFAHRGDRIIKLGFQSRCPSMPNFGDPETFLRDANSADISLDDIKSLLFYGLNDFALAVLTIQQRSFTLDTCDVSVA